MVHLNYESNAIPKTTAAQVLLLHESRALKRVSKKMV